MLDYVKSYKLVKEILKDIKKLPSWLSCLFGAAVVFALFYFGPLRNYSTNGEIMDIHKEIDAVNLRLVRVVDIESYLSDYEQMKENIQLLYTMIDLNRDTHTREIQILIHALERHGDADKYVSEIEALRYVIESHDKLFMNQRQQLDSHIRESKIAKQYKREQKDVDSDSKATIGRQAK